MGTLIKDVTTFKSVVGGVQQSIEFDTIKGIVQTAETQYIIPVLGDDFYEELCGYDGDNGRVKGLIDRLRQASGYYTLALATPQMIINFGDGGMTSPQNGQPITKWANVQLIESSMSLADKALETAIQYLERYEQEKDENDVFLFETWLDSDTYSTSKSLLINSATVLTEHFPVAKGSRRVFLAMLEYLKRAEKTFIKPLIGKEFFVSIKEKLSTNAQLEDEEEYAIELIRGALAHKAFSMAIPYLNLNADFQLISETDGVKNQDAATREKLDAMKVDCDDNAKLFSDKLKRYLDETASSNKLTVYFNSPAYTLATKKTYLREAIDPSLSFVAL